MSKAAKIWDELLETSGEERIDKMSELAEALEDEEQVDEAIAVHNMLIETYLEDDRLEDWCNETWSLAVFLRKQGRGEEALEIMQGIIDKSAIYASAYDHSYNLRLLGELSGELGHHGEAVEYFRQAAATLDGTGFWAAAAWVFWFLAGALESNYQLDEAVAAWESCIVFFELAADPFRVMRAGLRFGALLHQSCRLAQARESFENALTLARFRDDKDAEQEAMLGLARVHLARKEFQLAERLLAFVLRSKANITQQRMAASALYTLGELRRTQGDETQACEFERQAAVISRALGV